MWHNLGCIIMKSFRSFDCLAYIGIVGHFAMDIIYTFISLVLLIPQHRGFDTSSYLHPYPINEGVKRGEGG